MNPRYLLFLYYGDVVHPSLNPSPPRPPLPQPSQPSSVHPRLDPPPSSPVLSATDSTATIVNTTPNSNKTPITAHGHHSHLPPKLACVSPPIPRMLPVFTTADGSSLRTTPWRGKRQTSSGPHLPVHSPDPSPHPLYLPSPPNP
jgi:hypothetical protein